MWPAGGEFSARASRALVRRALCRSLWPVKRSVRLNGEQIGGNLLTLGANDTECSEVWTLTNATGGAMGLRLTQPEQVYVGWRYAQLHEDPGPPPQRPPAPEPEALDLERLGARRRAVNLMNRPAKGAAICAVVAACVFLAIWAGHVMPGEVAGFALLACVAVVGILGYPIWQGERRIRTRVKEERQRVSRMREARRRRIVAQTEQHRVEYENW